MMTLLSRLTSSEHRPRSSSLRWAWRLALVVVILAPLFISKSSQASFEGASINTSNAIPTNFYSVWGYPRNDRLTNSVNNPNDTGGTNTQFYEVWAVGEDARDLSQTPFGEPHGSIYYFDGTQWVNASPTGLNFNHSFPTFYYAVSGQYNNSGYADVWFGGSPDLFDTCTTIHYFNNIPRYYSPSAEQYLRNSRMIDLSGKDCSTVGHDAKLSSEIYAISADQHYRTQALAGGANGMLYLHGKYYTQNTCSSNTPSNGTCFNTGAICNNTLPCATADVLDSWTQINSSNLTTAIGATANISGMATARNRKTYLVATSATTTDGAGVHHLDRTCANPGTQKSGLFVTGGGVPVQLGTTQTGVCFYGVTVGDGRTLNPTTTTNNNYIWIAASNGVYRYDESTSTLTGPLAGTSGLFMHSVTNAERIVGPDQDLLINGNFEAWENNPATSSAANLPTIGSSIWLPTDEPAWGRNNPTATCGPNIQDISVEKNLANVNQGLYSMNLSPGIYYNTQADCLASINPQYSALPQVFTTVPLSNWQGRKIHVTGKYKATFTGAVNATHPQGGIALGCPTGGPADPQDEPDCTFENRSGIRTLAQGSTSGFLPLDVIMTVNDAQFVPPLIGGTKNPKVSDPGMVLQINCEATYGVQVWCDDLRVAPMDIPTITGYDNFNVTAVGNNSTIISTRYGVSVGTAAGDVNAFTAEHNGAATGDPLNSVWAIDPSHYYVGGSNSVLAQRVAGNVTGGIWVGTASPVASGNATLGWISANCANHRDANGVSLCQTSADTFGLDFQNNQLTGQAWFGKQYTSAVREDSETLSLGQCVGAALLAARASTYDSTGACNRSTRTCTANPSQACNRDFDCYGRCQDDQGFICTDNADCQVGATDTAPSNTTVSGTRISTLPANRLVCGSNNSSIQGCTGLGWLSFDYRYTGVQSPSPCGATSDACYQKQNTGDILNGWGRFLTAANSNDPNGNPANGWVRLRGNDICGGATGIACPSPAAPNYAYYNCQNCTGSLNCSFCQDSQQRSCLSGTSCTYYCQGTTTTCTTDSQCAAGVSCGPRSVCSLDSTTACSGDTDCGASKGRCVQGAFCRSASSCAQYGVNYSPLQQQFTGYGWSPEYGWLDFSFLRLGSLPFLQTRLGDIFANGKIGNSTTTASPNGLCNATYLITAGSSITNFCSVGGAASLQTQSPSIPTGGPTNSYTNVLGRLDVAGLERVTSGTSNKYGSTVKPFVCSAGSAAGSTCSSNTDCPGGGLCSLPGFSQSADGGIVGQLGGNVYTVGTGSSTTTLDQLVKLSNGSAFPLGSGAGIIIVNGNLQVNANIQYDPNSTTVSDLRQLASLVVIVKGNLLIDSPVTTLIGTYYVQGTVCTAPGNAPCSYGTSGTEYPLTVRGLLIAKQFKFNRKYAGTIDKPSPSELIIFDGRLQSNPMPGLTDFADALPNTIGANP